MSATDFCMFQGKCTQRKIEKNKRNVKKINPANLDEDSKKNIAKFFPQG